METLVSVILTGVMCGCCVLLCLAVSYLCVAVRRIRRKLDDLSGDGNVHLEMANKKGKDVEGRNRPISGRYTGEPVQGPKREQSAVYQSPEETVTYLDREVHTSLPTFGNAHASDTTNTKENIVAEREEKSSNSTQKITKGAKRPEEIPLQYINKGFSPDGARDSIGEGSAEEDDSNSQPIYENNDAFSEEPIYENNNAEGVFDGDEDIYQNTGQLRAINNPEWERSNTMKISQIH